MLVFTELSKLLTDLRLGDYEYVSAYQYSSNIEEQTYNHVRAYRANEDIGMWDTWVAQDTDTIRRWGQFNLFFEIEKGMPDARIMELARQRLKHYNTPRETLSIAALGQLNIHAGNGIKLNIGKIELKGNFWVTHCKHTHSNNFHTMDLELFYVA